MDNAVIALHGFIEFSSVSSYTAIFWQGRLIKHQGHECFIGNTLPLAAKFVLRCRFKPKARVVLWMSQNHYERATNLMQVSNPVLDKLRANTLSLVRWQNRHWGQPHSDRVAIVDSGWREQDVSNNGTLIDGDERNIVFT